MMQGMFSGFRGFAIIWAGQFISMTGSALTAFALGVYIYQLTGSVTTLGLVYALAFLPTVLASPVTGSLVDRWGPRRALLVSNLGSALVMLTLAGLLATHTFVTWHLYLVVTASSLFQALHTPAFAATPPLLVPARHIGRANGMYTFALAASQVVAPLAAGAILMVIDIWAIIIVDCLSFGVAILTLLVVAIPQVRRPDAESTTGVRSLLKDFRHAWRYVVARQGLLGLLLFIAALNFSGGFVDVLITPLVLAFAAPHALGTVMTVGGLGMIISSVAVSAWGGPRRRVRGILGFSLILAGAVVLGAVRPNIVLIGASAFAFLGGLAVVIAANQSIWQTKVPPHLIGRAMALQNMVANAPQLVAYALAGVAADRVFQPMVGRDEVHSGAVAALVGAGPGRGIALLLMLIGVLIAASVAVAASYRPLRRLEDELPDVTDPAGPAAGPSEVATVAVR